MPVITVVIADHRKSGRAACRQVLQMEKGIEVVGEARSGLEAMAVVAKLKPCILLFHLNLFKGRKINLLRALRQKSPKTKVILIPLRGPETQILDVLTHGVRGYIQEKDLRTFLPKAMRLVDAGEAWVPRKIVAKIIDRLARLTAGQEGG